MSKILVICCPLRGKRVVVQFASLSARSVQRPTLYVFEQHSVAQCMDGFSTEVATHLSVRSVRVLFLDVHTLVPWTTVDSVRRLTLKICAASSRLPWGWGALGREFVVVHVDLLFEYFFTLPALCCYASS